MKEQDFIHNIDEKTKELPIPDSISPDSMKKMLDEHIKEKKDTNQPDSLDSIDAIGKRNRYIRRFTAVACVTLCLVGSLGVSKLLSTNNLKSTSDTAAEIQGNDSNSAVGNTEESFGDDLSYQSNLKSPASYEEYYNTIKSAYDAYYDSISMVETYNSTLDETNQLESKDLGMEDSTPGVTNSDMKESISVADSAAAKYSTNAAFSDNTRSSATNTEDAYSNTNRQEENVDEGDIIKTDGTYIYKVITGLDDETNHTTYRLSITKTNKGKLTFITSFDLTDAIKKENSDDYINFQEFYLYKNQLICMYSRENYNVDTSAIHSYIVIYDLKDKKNPKKIKTLSQSGWYESSRISNGYLYTISEYSDTSLSDIKKYKNYIPCVNGETINCEDIYYPSNTLLESTHVVTTLNLNNPVDFTDIKAVPSTGTETYVSDSAIYFYATLYDEITKTEIMKINYDEGKLTVGNSAVIAGYLYGPFAINEYNDHLRIVATIPANNISLLRVFATEDMVSSGSESDTVKEDVNTLYILDKNMELTGKITGIAPGETIYSARFMGETGYFVTYRNMDPLFSVDLSDPANPVILGDLKVTGFSSYLHFYGKDTLLGIGEEIDPDTQEFLGLKLSMFDISNPSDVKEADKYIIKDSEFSAALYDYKAIMIDPDKNIFGFQYCVLTEHDYKYYYSTYAYEEKYGFIETARYEITDSSMYEDGTVRGMYIGDYFYLTTNKTITGYKIGSEDAISSVTLK